MVKATTIALLIAALVTSVESSTAIGQTTALPTVTMATDGILNAFQNNPLVGLSDSHGFAQEEDFYVSLVRDPRFAKQVGNVVVEFGNASQQQTIDRYVNGGDVPYDELREVWADTSYVGWFPQLRPWDT
ncbi:hypothetical protein P8936_15055 [Edaphobacter paludis]|uniref:Uncharacterized protein n=1 Tax=Edaphobacter paludis TaxID=3035702 RepID=A0AAU7D6H2_9BACT